MRISNPYYTILCRENLIENMKIFTGKMKDNRSFLGLVGLLIDDFKDDSYQTKEFLKDLQTKLYDLPSTEEKIINVEQISNINCVDNIDVMVRLTKFFTNEPYENNGYIEHLKFQSKELIKEMKQQETDYKITIEKLREENQFLQQRETDYKITIENLREENKFLDQR
jgi:hypothetical protein